MNLRNFTPHDVNLVTDADVLTLPSEGVARVSMSNEDRGTLTLSNGADFPLSVSTLGEVTGLPEEVPGTYLLVSGMVRAACPTRMDLLSPGELVRDDKGRVQGCTSLFCNE